jgi:hypothetical protein
MKRDPQEQKVIEEIEDLIPWLVDHKSNTFPMQQGFILDQGHHWRSV